MAALLSLAAGEPVVVVAPVQAVATKLVPPEVFARYQLEIRVGQRLDLAQVVESLQEMGYERVSKVETPGEFSVRGGFSMSFPSPTKNRFGSTSLTTKSTRSAGLSRLRSGLRIRSTPSAGTGQGVSL